ncbi:hypothetical protein HGRIS_004540 [Hohenbuehelia grisea]|uniref:MYND-type domain-containing protein n=1 Tax=Hohenbuehelia grisea TaxID=104357 RepID=A0ABR3JDE4_9AGAR
MASTSVDVQKPGSTISLVYNQARQLMDAEESKNPSALSTLDFSEKPLCFYCDAACVDKETGVFKPLLCGGCRAIIYCSRECQTASWKKDQSIPHRVLCPKLKADMALQPQVKTHLTQFPWGRVEKDGSFAENVIRARYGVYGPGAAYGYWSVSCGGNPLDAGHGLILGDPCANVIAQRAKGYAHGAVLLEESWPSHQVSWKLQEKAHIPGLFPDDEVPPPAASATVQGWSSWYQWRGLPMASLAALLMHYPLTVYHLLTNVLRVANTQVAKDRQKICVHYLGAEVELNFLPLFSELALLIPNADIELVFVGKTTRDVVLRAGREFPGSLATRKVATSENWGRTILESSVEDWPDAVVACNAGLASYHSWLEPIGLCQVLKIPFAVTDYVEQSLRTAAEGWIPAAIEPAIKTIQHYWMKAEVDSSKVGPPQRNPIAMNPFSKPGQRVNDSFRMPSMVNGFSMAVFAET